MIFIGDEKVTLADYLKAIGLTEKDVFGKFEDLKKSEKTEPIAVFKMKNVNIASDGAPLVAPILMSNQFQINDEARGIVTVTFTNNAPRQTKAGMRYDDPNYRMADAAEVLQPLRNKEKYVFYLTYPGCYESPMAKSAKFYLEDREKEAELNNEFYTRKLKAYTAVNEMSEMEAKELVASYRMGASKLKLNELKVILMGKIESNVAEFEKMLSDDSVKFAGEIQLAIEEGIVQEKTVMGVARWSFKGSETPFLTVPNGGDSIAHLKAYMLKNREHYEEMSKMMSGETEKDLIGKLYADKGKTGLQNKFLTLIEEGQLFFDAPNKNVTFVEGNSVLLTLESGKKWQEAAYQIIKKDTKLKKQVEEAYDKIVAV